MTPITRAVIYGAVLIFGIAICLYTGRLGFMPLDQSIVFDAGWRILSGQVAYQDFVTPTAVVPGVMQAVFFALFGVSWFSYVLHAALVNGVFGALVMGIVMRSGAHWAMAVGCGLASAVLFYPPMGTPYPEQHSLFFNVAALACVLVPRRPMSAQAGLVAAPLLILCAVMSKQNPGLAGAVVVATAGVWPHATLPARHQWRALAIGATLCIAIVAWATSIWSAHETFITYFWTMPNEEAARRGLTTAGALANVFDWRMMSRTGFYWLRPLPFVLAALALVFVIRAVRTPAVVRTEGLPLVVALGLYAVTVILIVYTRNQVQNAVGLVPLIVGLGVRLGSDQASTGVRLGSDHTSTRVRLGSDHTSTRVRPVSDPGRSVVEAWSDPRLALTLVAVLALALDTVRFHRDVNQTRMVLDLTYDSTRPAESLPPALSFLEWQTAGVNFGAQDLSALVSFLEKQQGNILVLGDSVYLYALTGRPSVNPNLWYHPGLTIPTGGAPAEDFDRRFRQALDTYRPRFLIMEGYRTWRGFVPMAYPPLRRWFDERGCREIDAVRRVQVFECR